MFKRCYMKRTEQWIITGNITKMNYSEIKTLKINTIHIISFFALSLVRGNVATCYLFFVHVWPCGLCVYVHCDYVYMSMGCMCVVYLFCMWYVSL